MLGKTWIWAAAAVAAVSIEPAVANLSMQQEAFVRGFNSFAQANGKEWRLTLKLTDANKIGKFVYDLRGCTTVTAMSKDTNQVIDTLLVTATSCSSPAKAEDLVLLARYLASTAVQGASLRTADDSIAQAFKQVEKTHKKQAVTVGQLNIDVEFSEVIGWVMRVQ